MQLTQNSSLVFKYLSLPHGIGGRGGAQRFFLLANKVPFKEELYGDKWSAEKKRLVESNENPCGSAPIIYSEEDPSVHLSQHIASSRYIATVFDVASSDAYKNYVQDLVADEYQGFRDEWVTTTFEADDEGKTKYRDEKLPKLLAKFDALYRKFKTDEAYLSVSEKTGMPLWGDAAVFGLLRDHILTGHMKLEDLEAYSNLSLLYKSYEKIDAVAVWIAANNR